METKILGRTGLVVTSLGYGAMELRGPRIWNGRPVSDIQVERLLNDVLDGGINLIDTSYDYGLSEELIGKYISRRRHEYYLATKCGCTVEYSGDHDETPHVWTRDNLMDNIETSLRRMKTDYVDVWQLHNPTVADVEHNNLLDVMDHIRSQGKARWLGISTTLPDANTFLEWDFFDTFQVPYSALQPEHSELITHAAAVGPGTIVRGAVAQGEPGISYRGQRDRWHPWHWANLDEYRSIGESRTALMLRFTLAHHAVDTAIVGTLNPEHLAENLRAAEAGPLTRNVYVEIKRRLKEVTALPTA